MVIGRASAVAEATNNPSANAATRIDCLYAIIVISPLWRIETAHGPSSDARPRGSDQAQRSDELNGKSSSRHRVEIENQHLHSGPQEARKSARRRTRGSFFYLTAC